MPSTPTSSNGFNLQATGENLNTWGTILNAQTLQQIDYSLDGITALTVTAASTITLSSTNYTANQTRQRIITVSGTMTGSSVFVIPNVTKWYHIVNRSVSGGYALTIKTGTGVSAVIPDSGYVLVYCDGTDTYALRPTNYGGQQIKNVAAPTLSGDVATQGYVLARSLSDFAAPTTNVSWGGYRLTNLGDPVSMSDAANMGWTLSNVSGYSASAAAYAASALISANSAASSAASAAISAASASGSAASALTSANSAASSAASAAASATQAGQLGGGYWAGSASGTAASTILITSASVSSYFSGLTYRFIGTATNTGPVTVSATGQSTAIPLQTYTGAALTGNEVASGGMYTIVANSGGSAFRMQTDALFVRTKDTQTLENKTISGGTVTGATIVASTVSGGTFSGTITATNAVLSGATISGGTFSGTISASGATITLAALQGYKEPVTTVAISGGSVTYNLASGSVFVTALTTNISAFAITGWPASGIDALATVYFIGDGTSRTVAYSTGTYSFGTAGAPTPTSTSGSYDIITYASRTGGVKIAGVYQQGFS